MNISGLHGIFFSQSEQNKNFLNNSDRLKKTLTYQKGHFFFGHVNQRNSNLCVVMFN